jgi:hypothetical protein
MFTLLEFQTLLQCKRKGKAFPLQVIDRRLLNLRLLNGEKYYKNLSQDR